MGYEDLSKARLHEPLTIPLEWRDCAVVQTDIVGLDQNRRFTANATLHSPFTAQAIGLVRGGWLPAGFAATESKTTVLVDRNIVTQIEGRFRGGGRVGRDQDFLDLFADRPIRINPLLYVMEGASRRQPTRAELTEQLEKVVDKLRTALPQAVIVVGPRSLEGAAAMIAEGLASFERNSAFLLDVAPTLLAPVGMSRLADAWDRVVTSADRHGVRRNALALLAVLSSIAVPNGKSPARRLLKFKRGYAAGDAYNALVDIRALELFSGCLSFFPNEPMQFCTGDKALALFWTGMQASDFARIERGFSSTCHQSKTCFPLKAWTGGGRFCPPDRAP